MRLAILSIALAIVTQACATAQTRPQPPTPDLMATPGTSGYIVAGITGCWLWTDFGMPNEEATWSGSCAADGRASGTGTWYWKRNGKFSSLYDGPLRDGRRHGHGRLSLSDGREIVGEFRDGKLHGFVIWTDGSTIYSGEFQDNKRQGYGKLLGPGISYDGEWFQGGKHGKGLFTIGSDQYDGEWRGDMKHGHGAYITANGNKYEGEWRNGLPDGTGSFWDATERRMFTGKWAGGCFRDDKGQRKSFQRALSECP